MNSIRYNKSKTYLLPLLSEKISLDKHYYKYIENCYIYDDMDLYYDCIYLEHNFSNIKVNTDKYENNLINNEYFVDIIQLNDNIKIFVFKFPELFKYEYDIFQQGKYSKFQRDAKHIIIDFFTEIYSGNMNAINFLMKLKQVLFKDNKLKEKIEEELNVILSDDAELTDIMDTNDETIKIKENITQKETASIYSDEKDE